jgi:hypothetical protein
MVDASRAPQPAANAVWRARARALANSPTARFFVIGALLFAVHRLVAGDPRVITVTPGVKADVERRFRDHQGRPPSKAELAKALTDWKREEALYREALHEQLDRDDPTIRSVLADKLRSRAALGIAKREPSRVELERWLAAHRELYETPRRYDYELVRFPKSEASAEQQLGEYQRALADGKDPRTLGRPIFGAKLGPEDLQKRLGPALATRVAGLSPGRWERFDGDTDLVLVRLKGVEGGGTPSFDELRAQLIADLTFSERQQAVERAVQAIIDRYRFEEQP